MATVMRAFLPADRRVGQRAGMPALRRLSIKGFALLLLLFVVAMFPEVIFGGRTFFYRDFSIFGYPLAHHLRESLWRGEMPLWNPLNNGGIPFLAQWNTMTLYPPSLFFVLFPLTWSLGIFSIAHLYLGGIGMYLLAHRWTKNPFAAAIAGMIYAFNGFAWYALVWPQIIASLAWAPFVLLCLERGRSEGRRSLLLAAVVGSLQMLTGGVEVILFTWIIAAAKMATDWVCVAARVTGVGDDGKMPSRQDGGTPSVQFFRFGVVVLLVSGLCAAQLLPFLDLAAHSDRGSDYADGEWPMPITGWANFLLPLFGTFRSFHEVYVQSGQQWTCSYFMGIVTVAFALFAFTSWRDKRVWLLWLLVVVAGLFALGEQSFLYNATHALLPSLGAMRYPVKFLMLPVIVLPLLAALGVAKLFEAPRPKISALLVIAGVLSAIIAALAAYGMAHPIRANQPVPLVLNAALRIAFLGLFILALRVVMRSANQRWTIAFSVICLGLIWLDNRTHFPKLNPTVTRDVYEPGMVRDYLKLPEAVVHARSRMMPSFDALSKMQRTAVATPEDECIGRRLALCGNLNLLDGLAKPDGFFALSPRETAEFGGLLYSAAQRERDALKDFVGANFITTPGALTEWTCRQSALPMVTSGQQPIFANAADTLRGLDQPSFDPKRFVYLSPDVASVVGTNLGLARVVAESWNAHAANLTVEASEPSLVVIAQSYYHCWRAAIDGAPTKLLRANHAFQAVLVPPGKHHLTLRYRDNMFLVGLVISLSCLVACSIAGTLARR